MGVSITRSRKDIDTLKRTYSFKVLSYYQHTSREVILFPIATVHQRALLIHKKGAFLDRSRRSGTPAGQARPLTKRAHFQPTRKKNGLGSSHGYTEH